MEHVVPMHDEESILTTAMVARYVYYVVLFVGILEAFLNWIRYLLAHNKKHLEILNKVTGELMIVGLIHILIKGVVYFKGIPNEGLVNEGLDAADFLVFFCSHRISIAVNYLACFTEFSQQRYGFAGTLDNNGTR